MEYISNELYHGRSVWIIHGEVKAKLENGVAIIPFKPIPSARS